MEFEGEPTAAAYTNRPRGRATPVTRDATGAPAGAGPVRALDRMLVALRVYEQRAQRKVALRAWLIARAAQGQPPGVTSPAS